MEATTPAYRASLFQGVLSCFESHPHWDAVRRRVSPASLASLAGAHRVSWVHAAPFNEVNAAFLELAGREAYVELWRDYTVRAADSTLFGPLISSGVRIFGLDPGGFIRWIPRSRETVTRNMGRVDVDVRRGAATMRLVDLPPSQRLPTIPLSLEGALYGIFEITRNQGEVDLDLAHLLTRGHCEFAARWVASRRTAANH